MDECNFDVLPNETVLTVFKMLDAIALKQSMQVCHRWNKLANMDVLWRKLCKRTQRYMGEVTKHICEEFSRTGHNWKMCYFWITKKDLEPFKEAQALCDFAGGEPPLKRKYLYARGIELFPKSPIIFQQYADFLAERPDQDGSWNLANEFYSKALDLANTDSHKKDKALTLYRYAIFLANQRQSSDEADKHYRKLLKLLPGNSWVFERYAEFLSEHKHQHNVAERILRMILNVAPSGSSLGTFAIFQWHVRHDYNMAGKFFKMCADLESERVYFFVNFIGRQLKDEDLAKQVLQNSRLAQHVEELLQDPERLKLDTRSSEEKSEDEGSIFSLALAYHQIHCVDEAEQLYRKHLTVTEKPSIYTLSNLAELLTHSRSAFDEAEKLYKEGLEIQGSNDTIEVALAGLRLVRGDTDQGLLHLEVLLNSSFIRASRTSFTEAWILMYIHCKPEKKREALTMIKTQLVTHEVRPKLILMFDANILWAKRNNIPHANWIEKLCGVYNCEYEIGDLDKWEEWSSINVEPPPPDFEVTANVLASLFEDDQDEEEEEDEEGTDQQHLQNNPQHNVQQTLDNQMED